MAIFYAASRLAELSPLEVHRLYKLRTDVFVHEQRTPYAEIEDVDAAPATVHFLAWRTARENGQTNELVGAARLIPEADHAADTVRLGRLVVAPTERGGGLAAEIMRLALRHVADQMPGTDIVLSAQQPLTDYYREFGFRPVGGLTDDTGVAHQPMQLTATDLAATVNQPV